MAFKTPTCPLPEGEGQGPKPDPWKHLPKKAKLKGKFGKPFTA